MAKLSIRDLKDLGNKRVFVRVDFNVPQNEDLSIRDDARIRAALPTINYLIEKGAKVILGSHLGRPKGGPDDKMRMTPVARRLSELLGRPVLTTTEIFGPAVEALIGGMNAGDVCLLENLRFHPGEEKNDPALAAELAKLCDVYISDAFGTVHRAHASTAGLPTAVKPAAAGFLIEKELQYLGGALDNPRRPIIGIIGGKKIDTKIAVIKHLLEKFDAILLSGAMTFAFLKAKGLGIGKSYYDAGTDQIAAEILKLAETSRAKLILPVDTLVADKFAAGARTMAVPVEMIPGDMEGVDIGPRTIELFLEEIRKAKTVVWNGPPGVFEIEDFARGSRTIAAELAKGNCISVIGGGDTAACVQAFGFEDKMSHVSTGGGASLEFMEGQPLPGIAALNEA